MNMKVAIKVEKSEVSYFNSLIHEVELKNIRNIGRSSKTLVRCSISA